MLGYVVTLIYHPTNIPNKVSQQITPTINMPFLFKMYMDVQNPNKKKQLLPSTSHPSPQRGEPSGQRGPSVFPLALGPLKQLQNWLQGFAGRRLICWVPWRYPKLAGLLHGKSQKIAWWLGVPPFQETSMCVFIEVWDLICNTVSIPINFQFSLVIECQYLFFFQDGEDWKKGTIENYWFVILIQGTGSISRCE